MLGREAEGKQGKLQKRTAVLKGKVIRTGTGKGPAARKENEHLGGGYNREKFWREWGRHSD